ncbi:peptidase M1 [Arthrobacter sp. MYb224]|uniref:M1 family metallopeptidase n=1 Tax=Arthrobacter sp. MYb224 TaxID=1848600 RepID=UPI000CFB36D7|nr:M1 family metallopeptidase [Arthrobacter sp. MYb224]PQZ96633.1 peptidase M1 [Arthrobacter sp. MYb224]
MPQKILDEYTKHHGSAAYTVDHYDLELTCKLASNLLEGKAVLHLRALQDLDTVQLNLHGLRVLKATCQGKKAQVSKRNHRIEVQLPSRLAAGERTELTLRYAGNPGVQNGIWGEVGWEELTDGVLVSGQPTGAATWFPCNDHPSHKSTYRFSIATDAGYRAVANGELINHSRAASRDTWVYEQREPMASYLATLQIGRYSEIPFDEDRHLVAYAVPGMDLKVRGAFGKQTEMAEVFERHFGPYPFESYKIVVVNDELEIPLEAQGLSIFGLNHLSMDWEAQRLIAHEFSHQWWGNSLTLKRWKDIWLHEGFACFSEWLYSEAAGVMPMAERARLAWELLDGQDQDLAMGDPGAKDMFDDRVYKRGAMALFALLGELGTETFYTMLKEWVAARSHGHVDTEAFIAHAQGFAPDALDVAALLRPWLYDQKLPVFPR